MNSVIDIILQLLTRSGRSPFDELRVSPDRARRWHGRETGHSWEALAVTFYV
jgi:hypothetical protein